MLRQIVMLSLLVSAPAFAQVPGPKTCDKDYEAFVQGAQAGKIWAAFAAYLKTDCDDAGNAEGVSDMIATQLGKSDPDFAGIAAQQKLDRDFERQVRIRLDATGTDDQMNAVIKKRAHCPKAYRDFCKKLVKQAKAALKEMNQG